MGTTFPAAADRYLRAKALARGARNEHRSTLRKWDQWGRGAPIEKLQRRHVREFLDWVYERAVADQGTNPGRTANKAREHLRAVLSWGGSRNSSTPRPASRTRVRSWLFYRRVKTGKVFHRPMNRTVHAHIKTVMPADPRPDEPVSLGGGARPNARFRELCRLAGIQPRADVETGKPELWELKDLRKTRATYSDAHVPESSVEILGHSVGGSPTGPTPTAPRWRSRRS